VIALDKLTDVFVAVADTLVADFDIIEFLELVAEKAATISAASAAGIVLGDPTGRLQFVAASEQSVRLLEALAVQSESGPCQDCFHTGGPVVNTDLRDTEAHRRWPAFARLATSLGYQSVHALPLRHQGTAIGALTLLSVHAQPLEDADVRVSRPSPTSPRSASCRSAPSGPAASSPSSCSTRWSAGSASSRPRASSRASTASASTTPSRSCARTHEARASV